MAADQGHLERAAKMFEEAIALLKEETYPWALAEAMNGLAGVLHRQGRDDRALPILAEALTNAQQVGDPRPLAIIVVTLAGVAATNGRFTDSARLLGAAESLATTVRAAFLTSDLAIFDPTLARVTVALGNDETTQQRARGQRLTLPQTIDEAERVMRGTPGADSLRQGGLDRAHAAGA